MSITVLSNEKPSAPAPDAKASEAAPPESNAKDTSAPEAKASEQNPASESETESTEAKEGESAEGSESESEPDASKEETETDEKDKPKKKGGFQRRIDKLNARLSTKDQELEYWKQQALKGASATNPEPKPAAEAKPAASDGKPKPDDFTTHAEYVEALTDWKTDQKFKEREQKDRQASVQSEQAKLAASYNERVKSFEKDHPDFRESIEDVSHIPASAAVQELILSSENGPALAYELAKNPEDIKRISALPPLAAAREMGKIEARLALKASAGKEPQPNKITNAPKPLETVGSGKGSAKKTIYDPNLSQKEYEALRAKERSAS